MRRVQKRSPGIGNRDLHKAHYNIIMKKKYTEYYAKYVPIVSTLSILINIPDFYMPTCIFKFEVYLYHPYIYVFN